MAAIEEIGMRRGAGDGGAHAVLVVLDDVEHRQLPERRHVEGLVDLTLVDGAVTQIGGADIVLALVLVSKGQAGADRHLGADNAVSAEEALLAGEHVHRAALAARIAAGAPRQFRHHAAAFHAGGQHVRMVAIAGDDRVAILHCRLDTDNDGFLADIEVTETGNQAHAVQLPRLLLEAADEQHLAVIFEQGILVRCGGLAATGGFALGRRRHMSLRCWRPFERPTPPDFPARRISRDHILLSWINATQRIS